MSLAISHHIAAKYPKTPNDDSFLPTQLAFQHVDYLSWKADDGVTGRTWRLATLSKDFVHEGVRKENALWRVWFQQKNNLKKIPANSLQWAKDNDITTLWGPLVLSSETCHTKLAIISGASVPIEKRRPSHSPESQTSSTSKGVLRVPANPFRAPRYKLCRSGSTESSSSSKSSHAVSDTPRSVAFNSHVSEGIIHDNPSDLDSADEEEETLLDGSLSDSPPNCALSISMSRPLACGNTIGRPFRKASAFLPSAAITGSPDAVFQVKVKSFGRFLERGRSLLRSKSSTQLYERKDHEDWAGGTATHDNGSQRQRASRRGRGVRFAFGDGEAEEQDDDDDY